MATDVATVSGADPATPYDRRLMRIAFLSWRDLAHPQAGGSEYVVDRLAAGLSARGHDVALFAGGPVAPRGYDVFDTGGRFSQYLRAPLVCLRSHRDVDVIVDVENGIPFFAPLWHRAPVVCHVQHVHTDQWQLYFPRPIASVGNALERRAMPRVYRRANFVAISTSTARQLQRIGVDPARIHTVLMGTDAAREPVAEDPSPLYVALGRLVPHKRVDRLLELWERVRPVTGGRLIIVGDGPERARLERLAGDQVEFTGFVTDAEKHALLGRAWLLLHPAQHEGWGVVIMEAAAMGTPSVGFDVPGVRDSVRDGCTGALATTEQTFVQHWIDLTADTAARIRLATAARAWAAQHDWSHTVDRYLEVLDGAIAGHRRRRSR